MPSGCPFATHSLAHATWAAPVDWETPFLKQEASTTSPRNVSASWALAPSVPQTTAAATTRESLRIVMPPRLGYSVRRSLCQYAVVWSLSALSVAGFSACGARTADVPARSVTFNKDVAPILFEQCTPCHRPGQMAPFG